MGKYTLYRMSLHVNEHFMECAYRQIYILRNGPGSK